MVERARGVAIALSIVASILVLTPCESTHAQPFKRGDANVDNAVDISDGVFTLSFLFQGGTPPTCDDALDANDDGGIDLSDAVATFQFLFLGGMVPPAPGPSECGEDPTADALDCELYAFCEVELDPGEAIQLAREGEDGPASIEIEGVVVTYLRPAVGGAPAGFFVQAAAEGPAIIVEVNPVDLDPPPQVGDTIAFRATELGTIFGAQTIRAIDTYEVFEVGFDVDSWVQDLTDAADIISGLDDYESELVAVTATVSAPFGGAGGGHVSAVVDTNVVAADSNLRARLPSDLLSFLETEFEFGAGCSFSLVGPMWRFNAQSQPSAYFEEDIEVLACPGPGVTEAEAIGAREVVVRFDRAILPASVDAPDAQFTFVPGTSVASASVSGNEVTLTLAADLAPLTEYTVSVRGVTDILGTEVREDASSAAFLSLPVGFTISEVDYPVLAHGGTLTVTGSGFDGATVVEVGGAVLPFTIVSDSEIVIANIDETVDTGTQNVVVRTDDDATDPFPITVVHLVINEFDADQPMTDTAEFIEVRAEIDGLGAEGLDLSGYAIVLYNGSNDLAYTALELATTTDVNGLVLIAPGGFTPTPQIEFAGADNQLQNGSDAIALVQGVAADLLNAGVPAGGVIDAVLYGTNDAADPELGAAFGFAEGETLNETGNGTTSLERCMGLRKNLGTFVEVAVPSPGAPNGCEEIPPAE